MTNFSISQEIVQILKCDRCDSFLNEIPVFTGSDGENICNRCSKWLDSSEYHRNVLYEILAQYLKFPCAYAGRGCPEWLEFNKSQQHERNCSFNNISQ